MDIFLISLVFLNVIRPITLHFKIAFLNVCLVLKVVKLVNYQIHNVHHAKMDCFYMMDFANLYVRWEIIKIKILINVSNA